MECTELRHDTRSIFYGARWTGSQAQSFLFVSFVPFRLCCKGVGQLAGLSDQGADLSMSPCLIFACDEGGDLSKSDRLVSLLSCRIRYEIEEW